MKSGRFSLEKLTQKNKYYRKVIFTTPTLQLVLMSLKPKDIIPRERHTKTTQFIRVESGQAIVKIGKKKYHLQGGDAFIIPPNKFHTVLNSGKKSLKLYTIYSPPEHRPDKIDRTYKSIETSST
jgi:mannose-6-phosphate isomerase-like protein (cupin superfamily)